MSNAVKNFLAINLSVLHNYFNCSIKLFLDLYLTKFLDISAKWFFSRIVIAIQFLLLKN